MAKDAGVRSIDDLRNFGKQIQSMGEQMFNVMQQAQRRMNYVSEGWHDDNNEKFKARFNESVKMIQKMSEEFKQYNDYLRKTCEILEMYKGNKLNL
jgi:uncharacterized protein YukE